MLVPGRQARAPFQIAHVGPHDRRRITHMRAALVNFQILLQQPPPTVFLGVQHRDLVPLQSETQQQRRAAGAREYHRLAAECRELAYILVDQRDDYLRMADTYRALAARA